MTTTDTETANPADPPVPKHIAQLQTIAVNARERARRAGLDHGDIRVALAAALLRARYPLAAGIEADMSEEYMTPQVTKVLGADGAVIHTVRWADDIPDDVQQELAIALDFAEAADVGWKPVDDSGDAEDVDDATIYRLALPPAADAAPDQGAR